MFVSGRTLQYLIFDWTVSTLPGRYQFEDFLCPAPNQLYIKNIFFAYYICREKVAYTQF
jgi:hypothetical protein